jgi:hypothetical protein
MKRSYDCFAKKCSSNLFNSAIEAPRTSTFGFLFLTEMLERAC